MSGLIELKRASMAAARVLSMLNNGYQPCVEIITRDSWAHISSDLRESSPSTSMASDVSDSKGLTMS